MPLPSYYSWAMDFSTELTIYILAVWAHWTKTRPHGLLGESKNASLPRLIYFWFHFFLYLLYLQWFFGTSGSISITILVLYLLISSWDCHSQPRLLLMFLSWSLLLIHAFMHGDCPNTAMPSKKLSSVVKMFLRSMQAFRRTQLHSQVQDTPE